MTTLTTLYSFGQGSNTDGADPGAGLTLDAIGDLFGTAQLGDSSNNGVVFELKAGATTATTLYGFTGIGIGADGSQPAAGLTLDANAAKCR